MASILTHFSILILYFLFPGKFDFLSLLIGCQFPDLEYYLIYIKRMITSKNLIISYRRTQESALHTILGTFFISIPLSLALVYFIKLSIGAEFNLNIVAFSLIVGLLSHLVLDIPAHRRLILFYPFVFKENPFLLRLQIKFIKKLYPYKKVELFPYQYLYEYNWLVLSHVFMFFSYIIYVIIK